MPGLRERVRPGQTVAISVCDITRAQPRRDQILALMEELNLDIAGEYIYEASLLIHLKSKMLLPRPATVEGEPAEDPRQELVERLLEYRRLKAAAQTLAETDRLRLGVFTRKPQPRPGPEDVVTVTPRSGNR